MVIALDYLSPLPPVRSGIADYSADLLPHLAALADLRVVRLPDQPVCAEMERRWRPVALAEIGREIGQEDRLALYQMGNNPYHEAVAEVAMRRPGILTLHDMVLHHLLHKMTLGRGDFAGYRDRLAADHGWIGEAASHPRHWGIEDQASVFALEAHRSLLRRQRGVLVHSGWAAERLREQDPELRVRAVPMGVPLPPPADRAAGLALRQRHGIPADLTLLGSFGFQTPIKRTATVVRALADPRLKSAHMMVVGESSPALDIDQIARQAGVRERVHLLGYLPFDELTAAIAATDVALNLRYPTAGETSASLLRVLAVGRPCVVSDYAQFAALPDEVVIKVPLAGVALDEDEPAALAAALERLSASPHQLRAMGGAARDHVRTHHNPASAARAVIEACQEWAELAPVEEGPLASTPRPVAPPTSLVWPWLPARIRVEGHQPPWPEGSRRELTIEVENCGEARWLPAAEGPGGMALSVRLESGGLESGGLESGELESDELESEGEAAPRPVVLAPPWLPLQRPVAPGEAARFQLAVRRPSGPVTLRIATRVLDGPEAEGGLWEQAI